MTHATSLKLEAIIITVLVLFVLAGLASAADKTGSTHYKSCEPEVIIKSVMVVQYLNIFRAKAEMKALRRMYATETRAAVEPEPATTRCRKGEKIWHKKGGKMKYRVRKTC